MSASAAGEVRDRGAEFRRRIHEGPSPPSPTPPAPHSRPARRRSCTAGKEITKCLRTTPAVARFGRPRHDDRRTRKHCGRRPPVSAAPSSTSRCGVVNAASAARDRGRPEHTPPLLPGLPLTSTPGRGMRRGWLHDRRLTGNRPESCATRREADGYPQSASLRFPIVNRPRFGGGSDPTRGWAMPAPRKYPSELRERAQRLVAEAREQEPTLSLNQAVLRIGPRVGSSRIRCGAGASRPISMPGCVPG
jgi:hypothetical protein